MLRLAVAALLFTVAPDARQDRSHVDERLAPLDFLVGHCWRGTLPTGEADVHCFRAGADSVTDHHDVLRAGKPVYSGDTLYRWDAAAGAIAFTYSSVGKVIGQGHVRPIEGGLDFGSSDYGDGADKVTIATRWLRVGGDAYDAIDSSANQAFARTTRYTRVD
ncbi:hypothetical protein [Sphingomonas sp.]|uniref:hypothetical protein n=1 Tax=Sphingomonas sp. TaxID=28214 RepID=UPI001B029723|nr:hypothetical protein [Sphingomonas sp.]MBO9713992.1 hypothetical protein [Sphingomonas sp.]